VLSEARRSDAENTRKRIGSRGRPLGLMATS
jgi:hypothetical protein